MLAESAQKETPGPLNRKRSRKGSRGQREEHALTGRAGQPDFLVALWLLRL